MGNCQADPTTNEIKKKEDDIPKPVDVQITELYNMHVPREPEVEVLEK